MKIRNPIIRLLVLIPVFLLGWLFGFISDVAGKASDWLQTCLPEDL